MRKLLEYLKNIANDKKTHNYVGQLSEFSTMTPSLYFFGLEIFNYTGLFLLLFFAGKEIIWDKLLKKGTCEFLDWWHTSLPIFQYLILINITFILWH